MSVIYDDLEIQVVQITTPRGDTKQATAKAGTVSANRETVVGRAQIALAANSTFLAIGAPTVPQTLAQVQLLTKECNGIIRLLLGQLDATTDT